jgi:hypothetical protein
LEGHFEPPKTLPGRITSYSGKDYPIFENEAGRITSYSGKDYPIFENEAGRIPPYFLPAGKDYPILAGRITPYLKTKRVSKLPAKQSLAFSDFLKLRSGNNLALISFVGNVLHFVIEIRRCLDGKQSIYHLVALVGF